MTDRQPHFFLRCEAREEGDRGEWNFALTAADGSATLEAHDEETGLHAERLELLAVVRALESLDQPSYVTLSAGARHVRRVLNQGLDEWRRQNWMWESYGELTPIKNADLWQRLDRCLEFHTLETRRTFRIDGPHTAAETEGHDLGPAVETESTAKPVVPAASVAGRRSRQSWLRSRRRGRDRADGLALSCSQIGAPLAGGGWTN